MIVWEDDEETVGAVALKAKRSLLRAVPLIMPRGIREASLYRLVLEHGDFGIHNTSITRDMDGNPPVYIVIRLGNCMHRPSTSIRSFGRSWSG